MNLIEQTIDSIANSLITAYKKSGTWVNGDDVKDKKTFYEGDLGTYYALKVANNFIPGMLDEITFDYDSNSVFKHGIVGTFTEKLVLDECIKSRLERLKLSPDVDSLDVISGYAGTLLWLLYFYGKEKNNFYLEYAILLGDHIVNQAQIERVGVSWQSNIRRTRNLLGFSHGASGISSSLLELWNITGVEKYYHVAKEGLKYENQFFNSHERNWPDFRVRYKEDKKTPIYNPGYMNAWCHGSNGIGVVNARFYQLTGDDDHLQNALYAYKTQEKMAYLGSSLNLCHGQAGNIELYLKLNEVTREPYYYQKGIESLEYNIGYNQKNNQFISGVFGENKRNYSLFLGEAGSLYACLRILYPDDVSNILYLNETNKTQSEIPQEINASSVYGNYTFHTLKQEMENYDLFNITPLKEAPSTQDNVLVINTCVKSMESENPYILSYTNNRFIKTEISELSLLIIKEISLNTYTMADLIQIIKSKLNDDVAGLAELQLNILLMNQIVKLEPAEKINNAMRINEKINI